MQTQAKQIKKLFTGFIEIPTKAALSGTAYSNITTEVATALATAGFMGGAVADLKSTAENLPGLINNVVNNNVIIVQNPALNKLLYSGREVYGRLVWIASQWRVIYYYLSDVGVETAYTLTNSYNFKFYIPYRFELKDIPTDFAIKIKQAIDLASGANSILVTEVLTVTSTNVVSSLSLPPYLPNNISLIVNGETLNHIGAGKSFTVTGMAVAWLPLAAGYDLETTDRVIAQYLVQI